MFAFCLHHIGDVFSALLCFSLGGPNLFNQSESVSQLLCLVFVSHVSAKTSFNSSMFLWLFCTYHGKYFGVGNFLPFPLNSLEKEKANLR